MSGVVRCVVRDGEGTFPGPALTPPPRAVPRPAPPCVALAFQVLCRRRLHYSLAAFKAWLVGADWLANVPTRPPSAPLIGRHLCDTCRGIATFVLFSWSAWPPDVRRPEDWRRVVGHSTLADFYLALQLAFDAAA